MTLKELLDRCDFKDIAPPLKMYERESPFLDRELNLTEFKKTFDVLRHLTPKKRNIDDEELDITFEWNGCEKNVFNTIRIFGSWYCKKRKFTYPVIGGRGHLSFGLWAEELMSEIVVSNELSFSDEEIAAVCLYELTYSGNWEERKP